MTSLTSTFEFLLKSFITSVIYKSELVEPQIPIPSGPYHVFKAKVFDESEFQVSSEKSSKFAHDADMGARMLP